MPRKYRTPTSLRPLALSQGSLSRADGSALFSFGNVSVLASITGPAEVRLRDELVDRATLEINVRPLRGLGGPQTRSVEATLRQLLAPLILLHLYPRSLLQLSVQTISAPSTTFNKAFSTDPTFSPGDVSGKGKGKERPRGVGAGAAEKAARINAAMMALVDAGVQCRGMLVAVAIALIPSSTDEEDDEVLLDPTQAEEDEATSTHVFAFSFGRGVGETEGTCVGVESVGLFSEDQLFDAEDLVQTAAQTVLAFLRKSVETKYGAQGAPRPAQIRPAEGAGGGDVELGEAGEEDADGDDEVMIDA
ncbi:hypothetical protein JCM11251_002775 [Rhodosporidiobolus azoricus]